MVRFTLFNIPVSIHWMFWLLAAFLGGALRAQTPDQLLYTATFMAAAFVSILVHELGHALAGLRMGAPRAEIHLHGMGGLAQFQAARFTRKQSILVTAAGPAASLALAGVFFVVGIAVLGVEGERSIPFLYLQLFVGTMIGINVFWTVFNLFPALPLDGGQIVRDSLGPQRIKTTCIISFITIAFMGVIMWHTQLSFNLLIVALLGAHTWQVFQAANADPSVR